MRTVHRYRYMIRRIAAAGAAVLLAVNSLGAAASSALRMVSSPFSLTAYAQNRQASVNTDRLNVRSGPGTSYSKVATLTAGTAVTVTGETKGSDGYTWYSISFGSGSGYARHDFISVNTVYAVQSADFEQWMNSQGFPESYKNGLRGLHEKYPAWIFTAQKTGLDWNTVITEESKIGRNLVASTSISSWKSLSAGAFDWSGNYWPGFDGASWVQASSELISYYMDPRNFLSDPYIFQFEVQTYNPEVQTREGLEKLLEGTFLDKDAIIPVEGSLIEGGTVIEGSTYTVPSGYDSKKVYTGYGSGASGPGGTGTSRVIGPGMTMPGSTGSGSSAPSGTASFGGPGASLESGSTSGSGSDTVVGTGPGSVSTQARASGSLSGSLSAFADRLTGVITSYANWQKDDAGKWVYYDKASGVFYNDGWHWLDGNYDGIAECYYFFSDGSLAVSQEVDGYRVNEDGKWVDENGIIQTKSVAAAGAPGSSGSGFGGTSENAQPVSGMLKKVSYADIIMKAAETSGVSPYVLASAILQEQGKGTSELISGNSGYYNFYNTDAYEHDGMSAVQAGLSYAAESGSGERPWNSIDKAIIGGASLYGASYVNNGQDTFYLKKLNVKGSNKFNHQFMTHVIAASAEGAKVSGAYTDALKNSALEFKIPVYENMPESTALPVGDGNPNNKLSALSVDGFVMTPTFNMDTTEYSLIVDGSVSSVNINASVIDSGASVTGAGSAALNVGTNDIRITVRAQNGSERVYTISITRRDNASSGTGSSSGIPGDAPSAVSGAGAGEAAAGPGVMTGPGAAVSQASGEGTGTGQSNASQSTDADVSVDSTVIIGLGPQ
ncbi:MAG: SH3 domain-containing protein [Clostridiales bacterium]|nr:SH3 domain-containing protein [Clostridiales bacterium]